MSDVFKSLLQRIQEFVAQNYGAVLAVGLPKPVDHMRYGFWGEGFRGGGSLAPYAPPEWDDSHTVDITYRGDNGRDWCVLVGITSEDRVRLDGIADFKVWED